MSDEGVPPERSDCRSLPFGLIVVLGVILLCAVFCPSV